MVEPATLFLFGKKFLGYTVNGSPRNHFRGVFWVSNLTPPITSITNPRTKRVSLRSVQSASKGAQTTLRGAQSALRSVQTALRGAQTKKKGSVVFSHTGVLPTNLMLTGVNCISVVKRAYMALPNIIKLFRMAQVGYFFTSLVFSVNDLTTIATTIFRWINCRSNF